MSTTTRRFTPAQQDRYLWLVLVGNECKEYLVESQTPDEGYIRLILRLSPADDIVVGRPPRQVH